MSGSYREILHSSSIIGGAQALSHLVALLRVKIVAVLLGPEGVGLVGLYTSAITLVGSVSGFGIASSGIREVAREYSRQDTLAVSRTVTVLRRACWVTGTLGLVMTVACSHPLSVWVTGSTEHAWAVATLGITLLMGAVNGGQSALLQGVRRIRDIAKVNIVAMLINTFVAIALYLWLGQRGIVPVLVATAAISLIVSWWYARQVPIVMVKVSWPETLAGVRRLSGLGLAFMWSGLLAAGMDMATRGLLVRDYGIEAAGIYHAAWTLSGMFAGFILSAMGTDFYPRLAGVIHDHEAATRSVNEQTEIGLLLALPGLLGTLAFAPWVIRIFYSEQFLPAASLLPWFVLGVFGRVLSWPLGYIQLAKGASWWFVTTETIVAVLQLSLLVWMVPRFGAMGAAYAFSVTSFVYVLTMLGVARLLIGAHLTRGVVKLLWISGGLVLFGFGIGSMNSSWASLSFGGLTTAIGAVVSLRGIVKRTGKSGKLYNLISAIPGARWLAGG